MKITDKMLHFSISFLTFSTGFLYAYILNLSLFLCYLIAFLGALALGIIKELIDLKWDWKDFLADGLGVITSVIIIGILMLI